MLPFRETNPRCKQCDYELDGGESICPRCQFSPRQRGLRVALGLLLAVVISMTILRILPVFGPILVRIAAIAFALSILVVFVSFFATPHRFGSLFLRL